MTGATVGPDVVFLGRTVKSRYHDRVVEASVNFRTVERTSSWDGVSAPPTSVSKAVMLGRSALDARVEFQDTVFPSVEKWSVESVSIHSVKFRFKKCWYYEIRFRPFTSGRQSPYEVTVFVYMGGRAGRLTTSAATPKGLRPTAPD